MKYGNEEYVFIEELMYCPSQIYYYFTDMVNGEKYCLYLRWRYKNPWSASIVECDDLYEFKNYGSRKIIETSRPYKEEEHELLEEEMLDEIKKLFPETYFPSKIKRLTVSIDEYFSSLV